MASGLFLAGGEELTPKFADAHASLLALAAESRNFGSSGRRSLREQTGTRVAFLPTAAANDGIGVPEYWASRAIAHFQMVGAAQVEAVMLLDEAGRQRRDLLDQIGRASVIYLGGGKPHLLWRLLWHSAIWEHICHAYCTGNWLAGTSAGAMVLGELTLVHADACCPQPKAWQPGLDVLPGIGIIPHYNTWPATDIADIVNAAPDWLILVCIDEHTALVGDARFGWVDTDELSQRGTALPIPQLWTVVGHGRVTVRARGQQRSYGPGDWLTYPAVTGGQAAIAANHLLEQRSSSQVWAESTRAGSFDLQAP
jgi:peptidase E